MTFTDLPSELISRVLQMADLATSVNCSVTCKRLHEISQDAEIQYGWMLDVCNMIDAGQSALPISEKLGRLREHERAWRSLAWTQSAEFPIDRSISKDKLAASDGVLAYCSYCDGTATVTVHRLPSKIRGVSYKTWTWTLCGKIVLLQIDPPQDLAMLYEYRSVPATEPGMEEQVQVRCFPRLLSTGDAHPLATAESCLFTVPSAHEFSIQLCGTRVLTECWVEKRGGFLLDLFDWTTGTSVWRTIQIQKRPRRGLGRVLLYGSAHLVHLVDEPVRLDIYQLGTSTGETWRVATLQLPKLGGTIGSVVNYIPPAYRAADRLPDDSIFYPDPSLSTMTFLVQPLHPSFDYQVAIPSAVLSSVIHSVKASADKAMPPIEVDWATLLNRGASISPAVGPGWHIPLYVYSRSGLRYVAFQLVHSDVDPSGVVVAQVLDRSPLRVARARRDGMASVGYAREYLSRFEESRAQDVDLQRGTHLEALFDLRTAPTTGNTACVTSLRCLKRVPNAGSPNAVQIFCGDGAYISLLVSDGDEPHTATVYSF